MGFIGVEIYLSCVYLLTVKVPSTRLNVRSGDPLCNHIPCKVLYPSILKI